MRRSHQVIPARSDQCTRRRGKRGRPPTFGAVAYNRHSVIERRGANLKQARTLATRCDQRAANYRALVVLAGPRALAPLVIRQTGARPMGALRSGAGAPLTTR